MSNPDRPFDTHFDGKRFFNPNAAQARGFGAMIRWKMNSKPEPGPPFVDDVTLYKPPATVAAHELRVTMVNHATVLIQAGGVHMLTDPMWSERASPVRFAGPKRHRIPGVRLEDLPRIDVVLLSHNHYDHFDLPTLRRFSNGRQCAYIAPLGLGPLLTRNQIGPVHELDWGQAVTVGDTTIRAVPAIHFSARSLSDHNRTLWCGYFIEAPGHTVYFAGDTAFDAHFAEIRARYGSPDLALLPIGAYEPRWFMSTVHMAPEEAFRAHQILGAKTSVGIHHGTFRLTDEGLDTPAKELRACAGGEPFLVLKNGESVTR